MVFRRRALKNDNSAQQRNTKTLHSAGNSTEDLEESRYLLRIRGPGQQINIVSQQKYGFDINVSLFLFMNQ